MISLALVFVHLPLQLQLSSSLVFAYFFGSLTCEILVALLVCGSLF